MKQNLSFLILLLMAAAFGQTPTPTPDGVTAAPAAAPPASDLHSVLARMDQGAKTFKSAQADFKWEQYTAVVKDTDEQTGRIFSRRKDGGQEIAIRVLTPTPKQVVVKRDKAIIYEPRINQTTERAIGNSADAKSVMNMAFAFGVKGQDLLSDYDVKLAGWETLDNIQTAKLELVARTESVRRLFSKVILWIDPDRDVAIQQQRFESSGDYQLAHYSNIKLNEKISDDFFTIKKGGSD